MKEIKVPSDVVKFILCFLGAGARFVADKVKINSAIYALSQDPEFNPLFKDFAFDTSRVYPHTDVVSFALDRLQKSDLLVMIDWEKFEVSKALSQSDPSSLFSESEIALLKQAAEKFQKMMPADNLKQVT